MAKHGPTDLNGDASGGKGGNEKQTDLKREILELAQVVEDSVGKFAALYETLLGTIPELKEKSPITKVWSISDTRPQPEATDFGMAPPRTHYQIHHIQMTLANGTVVEGDSLTTFNEHFAQMKKFTVYDEDGNEPEPGSAIQQRKLRIEFCISQLLIHHKVLDDGLFRLAVIAVKGGFRTDNAALVALRGELPHFPYCPQRPFTRDEGKALVLALGPFIRAGLSTLQRLFIETLAEVENYRPKLNEKAQQVLDWIKAHPKNKGAEIAKANDITFDYFRSMVPKLKHHGLTNHRNGDGYYVQGCE
jgi:hypothetical protein